MTLREAAQQALEALEAIEPHSDSIVCYASTIAEWPANAIPAQLRHAITALRTALAEQEDDLTAAWMAGAAEERKRAEQAQPDQALRWATQLAESLAQKHYPEVPQFKPLPDLVGVISQIDNMTCGLTRLPAPQQLTIERLQKALVGSRVVPPEAIEDPDNYDDGVTLARIEALYRRIT